MENSIKIIENFELLQLESFNKNEIVKMLQKLCLKLGLKFKVRVDYLENFNPEECKKRNLVHSGYLIFEVICDGNVVKVNNDDYGLLSWADAISELNQHGKYKLFNWDDDDELISEVKKTLEFLSAVN